MGEPNEAAGRGGLWPCKAPVDDAGDVAAEPRLSTVKSCRLLLSAARVDDDDDDDDDAESNL